MAFDFDGVARGALDFSDLGASDFSFDGHEHHTHVFEAISSEFVAKLEMTAMEDAPVFAETGGVTSAEDIVPSDTSTTATLAIGGSQTGEIDFEGDQDWFAVELVAGQSYRFTMTGVSDGGAGGTLVDPKMALMDSAGNLIKENDDSNGLNSAINFIATTTGTYYVNANHFDNANTVDTGTYTLAAILLDPITEVRTIDGIAHFLTDEYAARQAYAVTNIVYNIEGLTADAQTLAIAALDAWAEITGLTFTRSVETSGTHIVFNDDEEGAFASNTTSGTMADGTRIITSSDINVNVDWFGGDKSLDSYTYQTYLHEIGHALGLGHAGPYNGAASYGLDNVYVNDSWSFTLMSYFDQAESESGDYRFVLAPAIADIVAIQDLYGINPNGTRAGNTTYGFNSTEADVNDWSQFVTATGVRPPSMTIYDTGGIDTINLSGFSNDQTLRLEAETFSDLGDRGPSDSYSGVISIARGAVIENAIGGSGNDTITGNEADNVIRGGDGDDTLIGSGGNDTLFGDTGFDQMEGGDGDDLFFASSSGSTLDGGSGDDVFIAGAGSDEIMGGEGFDTVDYTDSFSTNGAGVMVNLATGQVSGGIAESDTLEGIEGVRGSDFDDVLIGNDETNIFRPYQGSDTITLGGGADFVEFDSFANGDHVITDFDITEDKIDLVTVNRALTRAQFDQLLASVVDVDGSAVFQLPTVQNLSSTVTLNGVSAADVTEAIFVAPTAPELNIINATASKQVLTGTAAADAFTFAPGTSTLSNIDTIQNWQPGDVIDLSALGLTAADLESRLVSGGTTLKLIEGFGANDFQLRINLGDNSVQDVLDSIIYGVGTPTNAAPDAVNDAINADVDTPVSFDVLSNDSDADNDSLTVTSFTNPASGTLTQTDNGQFVYAPEAGFTGTDSFTYTIDDGNGGTDTATVSINVQGGPTGGGNVISATAAKEVLIGTLEDDAFTFAPGTSTTANIDIVRGWQPGDVIDLSALGLTSDDIEVRTISGGSVLKLIEGFGASDFQLKIELGGNSVQSVLDSIIYDTGTPTGNSAPNAVNDTASTDIGVAVGINVLTNDSDADDDALTVSAFTEPASGSLVQSSNGQFSYTPNAGFVGTDSFTYTIDDGNGGQDTATVTINVAGPSDYNVIHAGNGAEILRGTSADDAFTFSPGTSTQGAIDIVRDWQPGDVIDLSALGLTEADVDVRSISGGATLKLLEGFGANDFQLKIELGGQSAQDVLDSIIYADPPQAEVVSVKGAPVMEEAGASDAFDFSGVSKSVTTPIMEDWTLQPVEETGVSVGDELADAPIFQSPDGFDWISNLDWFDIG